MPPKLFLLLSINSIPRPKFEQPVDLLFALLVPADQCKTHLHTLSLVAKRLADKTVCRRLRAAQSDEELYAIITEAQTEQ